VSARTTPAAGAGLLALYDSALPQVHGYLLSRCGDRVLAEDLTSEVFLAAVTDHPLTRAVADDIVAVRLATRPEA